MLMHSKTILFSIIFLSFRNLLFSINLDNGKMPLDFTNFSLDSRDIGRDIRQLR